MPITYPALAGIGADAAAVVQQNGSDFASFLICDSAGVTSGTVYTFPIKKDSTFDYKVAEETFTSEGKNTYKADGTVEATLTITFMQADPDTLALPELLAGQYVQIMDENNTDGSYTLYGICKPSANFSTKKPGNETQMVFQVLNNPTSLAVDISDLAVSEFSSTLTGTVTIASGAKYKRFNIT